VKILDVANRMREIVEPIQNAYPTESANYELAGELRRRFSGPRAPASSTPMTAELAEEIREYVDANSGMSHQAIAEIFNVNHGRVSEVIKGKRT